MKKKLSTFLLAALPFLAISQQAPTPYGVLPTERQLKWHEMETYCLIHFTPTTFQDKEWGYGDADVKIFNPSHFDAGQVARAAASAGFKGLISVAKHHDGFCLWPTKTTDYSIKSSPWKEGKGDMVKAYMEATHQNNMLFGLYLSAWDRNDTRYGTPAYTKAYQDQLTELMTQYGPLFTSWHDGANGGDGYYGGLKESRTIDRQTYYEWEEKTWPIVRKHQPMAMIFSDIGPDMRWVGNERGFAAETSWATFTPQGIDGRKPMPGDSDHSTAPVGTRNGKYWIPAECDVPQRPGWFYHKNQDDKVKTPNQLFEIYLKSVGRGANMNLGLAPMPEGYLHANDVKSLAAFGQKLKQTFDTNLAKGAKVHASNKRGNKAEFSVNNILDEDRYSYYAPAEGVLNPTIEISLAKEQEFDIIRLRENIKLGQRLDSVVVQVWENNSWKKLASATSIGSTRLIKLAKPIKATKLKLHLYAPVVPTLSDFALFKEYDQPFSFSSDQQKLQKLNKSSFTVEQSADEAAFDGNINTMLSRISWKEGVVIHLKEKISGVGYLPRQDQQKEGIALRYTIYTSDDKITWNKVKEGEFSNIQANPIEQLVNFDTKIGSKYIKFVPTHIVGKSFTASEINFYQ